MPSATGVSIHIHIDQQEHEKGDQQRCSSKPATTTQGPTIICKSVNNVYTIEVHMPQPARTPFSIASPRCPPVPETVYEEAFVPLEHGEMLQLQQPRVEDGTIVQNSPRTFGALLSQRSRTRTTTTDLEGKSIAATPYTRSTNDNAFATHTPVSFRAGRRTVSTPGEIIDAACVELARSGTFTCEAELLAAAVEAGGQETPAS